MPQYRTNAPVTFVHDGKVVSVAAHRDVEMDEATAVKLGEKVTLHETKVGLVFPKGTPVIDPLRMDPEHDGEHDAHSDKSEKSAKK